MNLPLPKLALTSRSLCAAAIALLMASAGCTNLSSTPAETSAAPATSAASSAPETSASQTSDDQPSDDESTEDESSAPETSESPSEDPSDDDDSSPAATATKAAKLTPWGTKLNFNEQAVQVHESSDVKYTLGLRPISVREGKESDLSKLKDAEKYKGFVPMYVTLEYENVGGPDLGTSRPSAFTTGALDTNGKPMKRLTILMGTVGDCKDPAKDLKLGAKEEICQIYLAPTGTKVAGFAWVNPGNDPIVWKK